MSQLDFARRMMGEIKRNPRFPPFSAAVEDAVDGLIEDAIEVARSMGALQAYYSSPTSAAVGGRGGGVADVGGAGGIPPAAQAAVRYYRPVLTQLFEAAMRLHLQVQGTVSTAYLFVPGECGE